MVRLALLLLCPVLSAADKGGHNCSSPPQLPLPGAAFVKLESTGESSAVAVAVYKCLDGFTLNGTAEGETTLSLECHDGHFDYEAFEQAGCARVADGGEARCWGRRGCNAQRSCRLDGAWLHPSLDVGSCGEVKGSGESCTVKCQAGYFQQLPGRYDARLDVADQVPIVLVCENGTFEHLNSKRAGPPSCVKAQEKVREFDVYALLRQNETTGALLHPSGEAIGPTGLPSNIDVFDLESLQARLYTAVHFGQGQLAELDGLYRERDSGKFVFRHKSGEVTDYLPTLPLFRDIVNTVVWYRLQVKNPPRIYRASNYEFGTFASFQLGKATNGGALAQYERNGAVVGIEQQQHGLIHMYKVTDEGSRAGTTPEKCNDAKKRRRLPPEHCQEAYAPRSDPRYAPDGRFNSFSLPGRCPTKSFAEKKDPASDDPECLQGFVGGLCQGPPDGSHNCSYSLKEVSRVRLDVITGITSQSCGSHACKDLRDFQLNCADESLRRGVKTAFSEVRECVEYAMLEGKDWSCFHSCEEVGGNASDGSDGDADTAYNVDGKVVKCKAAEEDAEVSIRSFRGRCSQTENRARLLRLQRMLRRSARSMPTAPGIVQDCDRFKECQVRYTKLGLGYCERDPTGVCAPCFVSGTQSFDPNRAVGLTPCRLDLFSSGGYQSKKQRPRCSSKVVEGNDGGTPPPPPCSAYLLAQRKTEGKTWQLGQNWSQCSTTCGFGYRTKEASCPKVDELGECRREIGDPPDGYCEDGQCFAAEGCNGTQCPWLPFCDVPQEEEEEAQAPPAKPCLPVEWGPVLGGCADGRIRRYRRCWYYAPGRGQDSSAFCKDSLSDGEDDGEGYEQAVLVSHKSRLTNCVECASNEGGCQRCAATSDVLEVAGDGSCTNKQPTIQLRFSVSTSIHGSGSKGGLFQRTPFSDLSKLVLEAAQQVAGSNSSNSSNSTALRNGAHLVDVFKYTATSTTTTSTTTVSTTTATSTTETTVTLTTQTEPDENASADESDDTEKNEAPSGDHAHERFAAAIAGEKWQDLEHWALVVALPLGENGVRFSEVRLKEMAAAAAEDLAASLEQSLQGGLPACGKMCSVSLLEEARFLCPGMKPWESCFKAEPQGGGSGGRRWWWIIGAALAAGLLCATAGAFLALSRRHRQRDCEEGAPQPGLEMHSWS